MALAKPNTVKTETAATEATQAPEVEVQQAAPEAPEVEQTPEVEQEVTAAATAPNVAPETVKEEVQQAVQHAPQQQQEVAQRANSAPATAGGQTIEQSMADMGLEGLSIGGMSFDRIKLPAEGTFLFGPNEEDIGKQFDAVVESTRAIYIVRQSDEENAENYYSYNENGLTDTNGISKEDTLQEWKEDGYEKPSIKRYLEVMLELQDLDENGNPASERHGLMAMASIPPASIQRISGVLMQVAKKRGLHPSQAVITFTVGTKVKNGANSFYPWNARFKCAL